MRVTFVAELLDVQFTMSVAPAVVPMAYQYLDIPESASADEVQLADNSVVSGVESVSAPVPSRTVAISLGGVGSVIGSGAREAWRSAA